MIIPNIWENKKWQPNHQPAWGSWSISIFSCSMYNPWNRRSSDPSVAKGVPMNSPSFGNPLIIKHGRNPQFIAVLSSLTSADPWGAAFYSRFPKGISTFWFMVRYQFTILHHCQRNLPDSSKSKSWSRFNFQNICFHQVFFTGFVQKKYFEGPNAGVHQLQTYSLHIR